MQTTLNPNTLVKSFMTNKTKSCNQNITLCEDNSIISNPSDVSNILNEYFIYVTQDVNKMSAD